MPLGFALLPACFAGWPVETVYAGVVTPYFLGTKRPYLAVSKGCKNLPV